MQVPVHLVYHCQGIALPLFRQVCRCQNRVCSRHKSIVALLIRSDRLIYLSVWISKVGADTKSVANVFLAVVRLMGKAYTQHSLPVLGDSHYIFGNVADSNFVLAVVFLPIMIIPDK